MDCERGVRFGVGGREGGVPEDGAEPGFEGCELGGGEGGEGEGEG